MRGEDHLCRAGTEKACEDDAGGRDGRLRGLELGGDGEGESDSNGAGHDGESEVRGETDSPGKRRRGNHAEGRRGEAAAHELGEVALHDGPLLKDAEAERLREWEHQGVGAEEGGRGSGEVTGAEGMRRR